MIRPYPDIRPGASGPARLSRRGLLGGLGLLAIPLIQACAGAEPTPTVAPAPPTTAPDPPATTPADTATPAAATTPTIVATAAASPATAPAAQLGGAVNVLATWGGDEQDSFLAMVKPFEERTGVTIQYEGTRDLNAVLTTRVQGGNPPDVAGLPGPGQMAQFARAGQLIDLATVLDRTAMQAQYSPDWLTLAQVDGKQTGIFIKAAVKGSIWYHPPAFQRGGYQAPATWGDLMTLSERIAATGVTPWSIGLESGAASGWPATDWLENIILRQAGPHIYDEWHQGRLKWTSPEIKRGWEAWGAIISKPEMVYGGRQYMLATNFGDAANPLFESPPRAYLHHQASFITDFITKAFPELKPVEGFNFFPFPDIDPAHGGAVVAAGDLFGLFKDTPQARALIQYLTTPEAQSIWVKRGGALSPNKQVPLDSYPDPLARASAEMLTGARIIRFDASDLMPEAMNNAFWKATLDYVNNPGNLDGILASLDRVQATAYG